MAKEKSVQEYLQDICDYIKPLAEAEFNKNPHQYDEIIAKFKANIKTNIPTMEDDMINFIIDHTIACFRLGYISGSEFGALKTIEHIALIGREKVN